MEHGCDSLRQNDDFDRNVSRHPSFLLFVAVSQTPLLSYPTPATPSLPAASIYSVDQLMLLECLVFVRSHAIRYVWTEDSASAEFTLVRKTMSEMCGLQWRTLAFVGGKTNRGLGDCKGRTHSESAGPGFCVPLPTVELKNASYFPHWPKESH